MAKNIQAIATGLGANIIGQVPETGGGAFGAARLASIVDAWPVSRQAGVLDQVAIGGSVGRANDGASQLTHIPDRAFFLETE